MRILKGANSMIVGIVVLFVAGILVSSSYAEIDPEHPEWLFEEDGNAEGWRQPNCLTIEVEDGLLKMETTCANDPIIFVAVGDTPVAAVQTPYLNVDAKEHPKLYARMSLSPNCNKIEFYYVTEDDAQWSERQVTRWTNLAPTGEMEEFEFEMGWQGTITGLRMDFADVAGIEIEMDYLSFIGHPGGASEATQSAGKLASTWASIKARH